MKEDPFERKLPALYDQINKEIAMQEKKDSDLLFRLQSFNKAMNRKPEKETLKEHPLVKGVKYKPISYQEMALDVYFFGQWQTCDYQVMQIANELIGWITLKVYHPISKQWLSRIGTASVRIMTDSIPKELREKMTRQEQNSWHLDLANKKPHALEMGGAGKLKADCEKNAIQSLGKYFGRDINRDFEDVFRSIVEKFDEKIQDLRAELSRVIDECQDTELNQEVIDATVKAEHEGTNTPEFYKKMIGRYK